MPMLQILLSMYSCPESSARAAIPQIYLQTPALHLQHVHTVLTTHYIESESLIKLWKGHFPKTCLRACKHVHRIYGYIGRRRTGRARGRTGGWTLITEQAGIRMGVWVRLSPGTVARMAISCGLQRTDLQALPHS